MNKDKGDSLLYSSSKYNDLDNSDGIEDSNFKKKEEVVDEVIEEEIVSKRKKSKSISKFSYKTGNTNKSKSINQMKTPKFSDNNQRKKDNERSFSRFKNGDSEVSKYKRKISDLSDLSSKIKNMPQVSKTYVKPRRFTSGKYKKTVKSKNDMGKGLSKLDIQNLKKIKIKSDVSKPSLNKRIFSIKKYRDSKPGDKFDLKQEKKEWEHNNFFTDGIDEKRTVENNPFNDSYKEGDPPFDIRNKRETL